MGFIPSWYSIRYRSDSFCTIAINLLNEIMFLIILIKLIMRGSVSCALFSIKQRTHFISIYFIHFKGFTLSWMGFILSWYSIRYRSDSFHHSNKPGESNHFCFIIILIKITTEGFSLVCFIIYKREDSFYHDLVHSLVCFIIYKREESFYHDLVHKIEGIHFLMDGINFIMVFISLLNGFILS